MSEFFAMNTPDTPHWTLKLRFGAFHTIWVHFRYERTRSTQLDPKLTFWCISYYLGAFGTIWLPYETQCKTAELVQKFVPRSRVGIFRNKCT